MYCAKRRGPGGHAFHGETPAERPPLPEPAEADPLSAHERRHAQLREANERLVLAAMGAQELQAAAEVAQRRLAEFMALVAQELDNPLAPIRIATSMLGRLRQDEPLLPAVKAIVEQQVRHMTRLAAAVQDVARVHAAVPGLELQGVDMKALIKQAIAAGNPAMALRGQPFSAELPEGPLQLRGDPASLVQIVGNLLDNASRYSPDGAAIELSASVQGGSLLLTVSDQGLGISAEALPQIFELFARDSGTMGVKGGDPGPGIGLTVVRALVEAHGGRVEARSAGPGQGSRFTVTLPL